MKSLAAGAQKGHTGAGSYLTILRLPGAAGVLAGVVAFYLAGSGATPTSAESPHTVQPGETLSGIASEHGVSVDAIMAANKLPSRSLIRAGQVLTIPSPLSTSSPSPTPTGVPSASPSPTPNPPATPGAVASPSALPTTYLVQEGDSLTLVASRFGVSVAALAAANGLSTSSYLYIGQELTIPAPGQQPVGTAMPAVPTATNRPPSPTPTPKPEPTEPPAPMGELGPKWIEIDLSTQMMVAYEGTTPVFSARMSSGTSRYPTATGTYRVYLKYRSQTMRGGTRGVDYYVVPNVPHVMYFFEGYALHGAYWHNNFGTPMSHGCVNLPLEAARWMYDWAPLGTVVVSHG